MSWRTMGSAMAEGPVPSRAVNLAMGGAEVRAVCTRDKLSISAIEELLSGGTRVVLQNGDDAARLRRRCKAKLIAGPVSRAAWAGRLGGA